VSRSRLTYPSRLGRFEPVWAWVGHDEPNYTYSDEGRNLLTRLSHLSSYPVHVAVPSPEVNKLWVRSRDASGRPLYDWTIIDRIFDAYETIGITPFVEIGFMPEALSVHPEPYQHWPQSFGTGWLYPPKNYQEWSNLLYEWVRHMADRYGAGAVVKWDWEVWNEPDIVYWHGTIDEYCKLYDYTVAAVKRALPNARVGGLHALCGGSVDSRATLLKPSFSTNPVEARSRVQRTYFSFPRISLQSQTEELPPSWKKLF
jgi:xylan 1,4-beta-xylosidase